MASSTPSTFSAIPSKIGILVVGLGGNNGVTLVAGLLANQQGLSWETRDAGRVSAPNWNGCITQLSPRGKYGGVGFQGRYPLATKFCVGGWDIRPTPLGDALYDSRVLDYDLVRQVRDEMNEIPIWKGVYDSSFLGESQYATATHVINVNKQYHDRIQQLRGEIQAFKKENQVDGHTTVIWSASVERQCTTTFQSGEELLDAIVKGDDEISPSILYAVAAALEGCSFVNGGSQNTLSDAMCEVFESSFRGSNVEGQALRQFPSPSAEPAYVLGTDFKAGQTKFKTAAVEYIRALGLTPQVIASSNHLGNNDMLNLTSKKTVEAKMRVKSNIFGAWQEEQLDHQVRVMYTPFMLDEKRDVVEYTSLGFLHCPHTMLTYTRCMDSILCVPLMIDGAVWCDFFARYKAPSSRVARATAYLFKVPEGRAIGLDPGFHRQMSELETALEETTEFGKGNTAEVSGMLASAVEKGMLSQEQAEKMQETMLAASVATGIITQEQADEMQSKKRKR